MTDGNKIIYLHDWQDRELESMLYTLADGEFGMYRVEDSGNSWIALFIPNMNLGDCDLNTDFKEEYEPDLSWRKYDVVFGAETNKRDSSGVIYLTQKVQDFVANFQHLQGTSPKPTFEQVHKLLFSDVPPTDYKIISIKDYPSIES